MTLIKGIARGRLRRRHERSGCDSYVTKPYSLLRPLPIIRGILGEPLSACIGTIGALLPNIQSGALRALATSAPERSGALPDVPTFKELGYSKLESIERFGIVAPARTPADVIQALHKAVRDALGMDAAKAGLAKLALESVQGSPSELMRLIRLETDRWAEVVKASGFKPID